MNTVRFKLSRTTVLEPGIEGRKDEVVDVSPIVAAQLLSAAAGELVDPAHDRTAINKAVRDEYTAQARLVRSR